MRPRLHLNKFLLFLLIYVDSTYTFNLDLDNPIIYDDAHKYLSTIVDYSFFGYSVILYPGNENYEPWIQIGAPRGHDLSKPGNQTGCVFRCPIKNRCDTVPINEDLNIPQMKEIKDGAWIGATMDIDVPGNRTIVCAYRLQTEVTVNYFIQGACYWSTINSYDFHLLAPMTNKSTSSKKINSNLVYFTAMAQLGFSVHLTSRNGVSSLLLGAPGIINWRGTVIVYEDLVIDSSHNMARGENIAFSYDAAYYGYAVTSGYFYNQSQRHYVMSSGRGRDYMGEIIVYDYDETGYNKKFIVYDKRIGSQVGEYFGASLTAGDLDNDGFCDLVVGAPTYKKTYYNEGRIYIFYGSEKGSLQVLETSETITGNVRGGQFGISLAYLGDLDKDGYGDLVVGATNEDDGRGVIYIYRGSSNGLITQPSQTIRARDLDNRLRGFGISFSKLTDIDNNRFGDLAVGAYKSGHAVILRSRPVIDLHQSVNVEGRRLNVSQSTIEICLWYSGDNQSESINVSRTLTVDDSLRRLNLDNPADAVRTEILTKDQLNCKSVVVRFKPNQNIYLPVTVRVEQSLLQPNTVREPFVIDSDLNSTDYFCKTCPVARENSSYEISLPVELGCGEDQVCQSDLSLKTKFGPSIENGTYVIGSDDYIQIETTVENLGEKAYVTVVSIELPKHVQPKFIPTICMEISASRIDCSIGNPIHTNQSTNLSLELNMKAINIDRRGESIKFNVSVRTSSENLNPIKSIELNLDLISEGDIYVTGKSSKQVYSYGNTSNGNSQFTQIYQVQKVGRSTVDRVFLDLYIPTTISSPTGNDLTFISLVPVSGTLSGRTFTCENQTYVKYTTSGDDDDQTLQAEDPETGEKLRQKRQTDKPELPVTSVKPDVAVSSVKPEVSVSSEKPEVLVSTEKAEVSVGTEKEEVLVVEKPEGADGSEKPEVGDKAKSFLLNCEKANCARIRCAIGPFTSRQTTAFVKIKGILDATALQEFVSKQTAFILTSTANVTVENFVQSGDLDDSAEIMTIFHSEIMEKHVDIWIIVVSVIVAILILLLLILGLVKAGFFKRKQKMELEALKHAEAVEEFEKNAKVSEDGEGNEEDEISEHELKIEDEENCEEK